MSLIGSLHTTFSGIRTTEAQMSTVSSNVANADKAGYTKKTYQTTYTISSGITVPSGGVAIGTVDKYLSKAVIDDVTDVGYYNTIAIYLDSYSSALGTISTGDGISASLNDLATQISALATSPEDNSQKINVIDAAETIALTLNNLSQTIQGQRLQANQEIEDTVATINQTLRAIDDLNQQILVLQTQGASAADLEDERMVAIETLAELIDISYFTSGEGQIKIYTSAGQPLLDSEARTLSYTASTSVTGAAEYPANFDAITLNGVDITGNLQGGKLGALVELRDEILVQEQDKLDELANVLSSTLNDVVNTGSSYPPRSEMVGDTDGLSAGDAFSASGTLRLAVTDDTGTLISYNDINLGAYATIGDVVSAIDALSGIQASLSAEGELVLNAENAGEYISMNQMDSSVGTSGKSFGSFFGLNNLFMGEGAEYIAVSDYLKDNPEYLATGVLSSSATLAAGDRSISSGDGTTAENLQTAINGKFSFSMAGNFAAQTVTLISYSNNIVSHAATRASSAESEASIAQTLYDQTKSMLQNETGVNIDEETARMTELESHYEAAALLISTIQDMFDALVAAVR
jgi:flagellar hook-associated protein 1 FlgK